MTTITLTIDAEDRSQLAILDNAKSWIEERRRIRCDILEDEDHGSRITVVFRFEDAIDGEDFRDANVTSSRHWQLR